MSEAASISVVNMSLVKDQIQTFAKSINRSVAQVGAYVFGLWVNDIMKSTPPFSSSQLKRMITSSAYKQFWLHASAEQEANYLRETGKAMDAVSMEDWSITARQVGARRVKKDISRIMGGLPSNFRSWEAPGERIVWVTTPERGGKFGVDKELFRPSSDAESTMKMHHARYRSPVTGRVTQAFKTGTSIGRWKFINKLMVPKSRFDWYVEQEQKAVGALKAGWCRAVAYFGGRPVASWISGNPRQARGKAGGSFDERGNGELYAINDCPYAYRTLEGIAESTARTRQRDLETFAYLRAESICKKIDAQTAAMTALKAA